MPPSQSERRIARCVRCQREEEYTLEPGHVPMDEGICPGCQIPAGASDFDQWIRGDDAD